MSRKSAASLSVVVDHRRELPSPPDTFTQAQAQVWCAVVATKPVDWFQADCIPILADYCRAVATSNDLAVLVDSYDRSLLAEPHYLKEWTRLLKQQRDQQLHVATLATKLRLTPQSRYAPSVAATANAKASGVRPWQDQAIPHGQTGT